MARWWVQTREGQMGPVSTDQVRGIIQENPDAWVWLDGKTRWRPAQKIRAIQAVDPNGVPLPLPPRELMAPMPKSPPQGTAVQAASMQDEPDDDTMSGGFGSDGMTDGIDFRIVGSEMQFVEVELDPGESAIAEAGAMMFKSPMVEMQTIFGDGSNQDAGFLSKAFGATKRVLTGESLFMTVFTHGGGAKKAHVAFGAPYPGNIIAINLAELDGPLILQKDSFLAASKGVSVDLHIQKRILTGLFGGEGFIMQRLTGDGWAFMHVGGTVVRRDLGPGEELHVDTGCVAGYTGTVDMEIERAGNITTMLFGGEGLFYARLRGPGIVWMQSLPFSRMAGRMLAAAPQTPGGSRGEGSVLGPIGGIFRGDNSV